MFNGCCVDSSGSVTYTNQQIDGVEECNGETICTAVAAPPLAVPSPSPPVCGPAAEGRDDDRLRHLAPNDPACESTGTDSGTRSARTKQDRIGRGGARRNR